jgi:hypothetical protein
VCVCLCACACACEWRRCALPLVWASCAPAAGAGGGVVAARVFALPAAPVSPTPPCFVRPAWLALGQSVCVYYFFLGFFLSVLLAPPLFWGLHGGTGCQVGCVCARQRHAGKRNIAERR